VQVDPIKPTFKAPGTERLKLKYEELLSSFGFEFNLRRYSLVAAVPALPPSVAPRLRQWHALLDARRTLTRRVEEAEYGLSDANLRQMPDFETRVRVLQSMVGVRVCVPLAFVLSENLQFLQFNAILGW